MKAMNMMGQVGEQGKLYTLGMRQLLNRKFLIIRRTQLREYFSPPLVSKEQLTENIRF